MTLHVGEFDRAGAGSCCGGLADSHSSDRTSRWQVQRSEVILPPPSGFAVVLALGLLVSAGGAYSIIRKLRRR